MKRYLKKLPKEISKLIKLVSQVSQANNVQAYLVGGFVRDFILGVANLDLDIVVEGDGIAFAEDLAVSLEAKITRHKRFGTATLFLSNHLKIDVASARDEYYPYPASLPVVKQGSIKDDLKRRDFTINAMAINVTGPNYGSLVDFFDGKRDLAKKRIKVLHPLSFIDDPTRILRAVRFEKRYNFDIEPRTLKYLKRSLRINMLKKVQPQRLRDELILLLKEQDPVKGIKRLNDLGSLSFIKPGLHLFPKRLLFLRAVKNEIDWFNRSFSHRRRLDVWLIYLAALLDSLTTQEMLRFFRNFVFRKGEEKRVICYKTKGKNIGRELKKSNIRPSRIFRILEPLSYETIILIKAKYAHNILDKHIEDFFTKYNGMRTHIRGEDLARLGIAPGPHYQRIFAKIISARIDGRVKTKDDEFFLVKKLLR